MGSRTYVYTFTGAEPAGAVFLSAALPSFTGSFTTDYSTNGPAGGIINMTQIFRRSSDSTTCWSTGRSMVSGDTSKTANNTVGSPSFDWHCGDWDTLQWAYGGATDRFGAGRVLTITLSGAGISSAGGAFLNYKLTVGTNLAGTDPQYQALSQKNLASGYAGLDSNTRVPTAQLGSGTASSSTFLRGDQSWATPAGGGGGTAASARVYNSTAISVATGTIQALTFNSERWDTESIHNTSTNTSRLTCQTAGKYVISGTIEYASHADNGVRDVYIRLNGATLIGVSRHIMNNIANTGEVSVSTIYDLAVNDYVELCAFQNTGAAVNVTAAGNYSPEFSMVRIGA
jgi:hypothetical protein